MDEFNSSDIEFDAPVKKSRRILGQRSIQQMIDKAPDLRIQSKKTAKQLSFGTGRQETKDAQLLTIERFKTFRTDALRHANFKDSFSGDDAIRFLDSIIGIIIPSRRNKPAPNASTAISMIRSLSLYSIFTYNHRFTPQESARINTWFDDAKRAGRLTVGNWSERIKVGVSTLSYMVKTWFKYYIQNGTISWDIVLYKAMSVVIVGALACRVGDVARSSLSYAMEYIRYRDIEIAISSATLEPVQWRDLEAKFTLRFTKFKRDTPRENDIIYLAPLDNEEVNHICPLALLISHCLRHGLVQPVGAKSLQDVLDYAVSSGTRTIQWVYPDYPVMVSLAHSRLLLTITASGLQLSKTIKLMGIMSGVVGNLTGHCLRSGAARDISHLPTTVFDGVGLTTPAVAAVLNHSEATFSKGTSRHYAGEMSALVYNERIKVMPTPRGAPKITSEPVFDIYRAPVSLEEIQIWQKDNQSIDSNPLSFNSIRKARKAIRDARLKNVWEESKTFTTAATETSEIVLEDLSTNTKALPRKDALRSIPVSDAVSPPVNHNDLAWHSNIDPRLLSDIQNPQSLCVAEDEGYVTGSAFDIDEDVLGQVEVASSELNALHTIIAPMRMDDGQSADVNDKVDYVDGNDDDNLVVDQEELLGLLGEAEEKRGDSSSIHGFVDKWTRINAVNNKRFAEAWPRYSDENVTFEESIEPFCATGNTRDFPTPFLFTCTTSGCNYSTIRKFNLSKHSETCTEESVRASQAVIHPFSCDRVGCAAVFTTKHNLQNHIYHVHSDRGKPCANSEQWGCDPNTLYTPKELAAHRNTHGFPCSCAFPGCKLKTQFSSKNGYRAHLKKAHKISSAGYMPSPIAKPKAGGQNKRKRPGVEEKSSDS
ncbi:putative zinc finger x-linked protein [Botrytis fragariae]|uniref:Putative zinc finger x-linked protein n=1 Tax=Botrytis fragariae TaxID=1964551 RepID=A0A8H6EHN8_9HELO|nr:putative zinc finger x-linked protein [Botrytis fragariae]KAF5872684.1 putative zinc finger x-linked protein [Botrytis fragariae]